jgi:bacillithiol biosynthesis deacetylase BshB1
MPGVSGSQQSHVPLAQGQWGRRSKRILKHALNRQDAKIAKGFITGPQERRPMDVLAIGAHPDDCELFMGGTLAKLSDLGHEVAIADLSRGECASRGTPEIRAREAEQASKILGLAKRICLDLGDTRIGLDAEHRVKVVNLLRAERPFLVFTHSPDERHPDHGHANRLVREACFFAYVGGVDTGRGRFDPATLIEFIGDTLAAPPSPSFVVPIGETFSRKMESLRAYESQFHNPDFIGPDTWHSSKGYFEQIEARARYWGSLIGENFGEGFCYRGTLAIGDPVAFFRNARAKGG